MPTRPIADVLAGHTPRLMAISGVVGTYEGALDDGTPCIKVLVVKRTGEHDRLIPSQLEGYRVVIEESGEIRAMPDTGS